MTKIQGKQLDPKFSDAEFEIQDDADPSKIATFQASGITTATTRVITLQDADGTMAYLADISGGGTQKVVEYDAIVAPSGGDFTTVKAALDNGDQKILVTGSVTETANLTVSGWDTNPIIHLMPGVVWDFDTFTYSTSGSAIDLTVMGVLDGRDDVSASTVAEITWANAAGADWFTFGVGTFNTFRNLKFDDNASVNGSAFTTGGSVSIYACRIELPNITGSGIQSPEVSSGSHNILEDVTFVGGGTNCIALTSAAPIIGRNIRLSGTFALARCFDVTDDSNQIDGIYFACATDSNMRLAGRINNVFQDSLFFGNLDVDLAVAGTSLSNLDIEGELDLGAAVNVSNFVCDTIVLASTANIANGRISDLTGSTFNSNRATLTSVTFTSSGTMSLGTSADQSTFIACKFASSSTINFNSGATLVRFIGCDFNNTPTISGTVPTGINRPMFIGCGPLASNTDGVANGFFTARVGSGEQYTTIASAVADNHQTILVTGDISEPADVTIDENTVIVGDLNTTNDRNNITFSTGFGFVYSGSDTSLSLDNLEVTFAFSSADTLFDSNITSQTLILNNCVIDNNSSVLGGKISDVSNIVAKDCRFELPNQDNCGFEIFTGNFDFVNCEFVGGGTTCSRAITITANAGRFSARNLEFSGTFSTSVNVINHVTANANKFIWDGILISSFTTAIYEMTGIISNVRATGTNVVISLSSAEDQLLNSQLTGAELVLSSTSDRASIQSVTGIGTVTMTGADDVRWASCEFDAAITFSTNGHNISNCKFISTVAVSGDQVKFNSCHFDGAVTVSSGAANTSFSSCHFESTLTDSTTVGQLLTLAGCTPFSREEKVVGVVTGIDLTSTGTTTLFTVPTSSTFYTTKAIVVPTAVTAPAGDAVAQVEITASSADVIASQTLTALTTTAQFFHLSNVNGLSRPGAAAESISFRVTSGDTGTAITATVYLIGVLV